MAKPFMCGDEVSVYVPDGGCDCNYTIVRVDDEDYYATYKLLLNGENVGETIQVPHDKYVVSGEMAIVTTPNSPYYGAQVGDYYIDIVIGIDNDHVFIPLDKLKSGGFIIVDDVSDLPSPGDPSNIYLVPSGSGYDEYLWVDDHYEVIGSTNIDLSDYYTKSQVDALIAQVSLVAYPVGSIYVSVNSTNPGTIFGGTWEQIKDRFLLAAGSTYSAGSTGGAASVTLTAAQSGIRAHGHGHTFTIGPAGHKIRAAHVQVPGTSGAARAFPNSTSGYSDNTFTDGHTISGSISQNTAADATSAHTNMPPYLTVYVWKRTA